MSQTCYFAFKHQTSKVTVKMLFTVKQPTTKIAPFQHPARKMQRITRLRIRRYYSGRQPPRQLGTTVHRLRSLQGS